MTAAQVEDPRLSFVRRLDISRARIHFSRHIVLIFGGLEDITSKSYTSLRDALLKRAPATTPDLADYFKVPENFKDWLHFSNFEDLVTFEKYLAAACSLVVIALETPGSIAELGVFSQLPEMAEKLLVVVPRDHYIENSFIKLGILAYLGDGRRIDNENPIVRVFDWKESRPSEIEDDVVDDTLGSISKHLESLPKTPKFSKNNVGHIIIVISELIRLFKALKEKELFVYLQEMELPVDVQTLKKYLFVLQKIDVIREEVYDDSRYFVSLDNYHKLQVVTKPNTEAIDSLRVQADCMRFYEAEATSHRRRVIKRVWGEQREPV